MAIAVDEATQRRRERKRRAEDRRMDRDERLRARQEPKSVVELTRITSVELGRIHLQYVLRFHRSPEAKAVSAAFDQLEAAMLALEEKLPGPGRGERATAEQ